VQLPARQALRLSAFRLNYTRSYRVFPAFITQRKETPVRPILLWILGLPIPIIILLYLFNVL
jgi:hypothetical protein